MNNGLRLTRKQSARISAACCAWMRENYERGLYEGEEYQYWQKVSSQRRLPMQPLLHRRLRLTHVPQHAPLPQPVRLHMPPLLQLRATLWLLPWRDRQLFGLASS